MSDDMNTAVHLTRVDLCSDVRTERIYRDYIVDLTNSFFLVTGENTVKVMRGHENEILKLTHFSSPISI